MKIIGQSTVANGTPYVHLAYVSATTFTPQSSLESGGLMLLVAGIFMTSVFGKRRSGPGTASPPKKTPPLAFAGIVLSAIGCVIGVPSTLNGSISGLVSCLVLLAVGIFMALFFSQPISGSTGVRSPMKTPRLAVVGIICFILGGIGWILSLKMGTRVYTHPMWATQARQQFIVLNLMNCRDAGMPIPADMAELRKLVKNEMDTTDGWFREMRFVTETSTDGEAIFAAVSAGPDGVFGTDDDVRCSSDQMPRDPTSRASTSRPAK